MIRNQSRPATPPLPKVQALPAKTGKSSITATGGQASSRNPRETSPAPDAGPRRPPTAPQPEHTESVTTATPANPRRRMLEQIQQAHEKEKARDVDLQAAKRMLEGREAAQVQPKKPWNRITRHFHDPKPGSRSALYDRNMGEYHGALGLTSEDIVADRKAAAKAGWGENIHTAAGRLITGSTGAALPAGQVASPIISATVGYGVVPFVRGALRVLSKPHQSVLQQKGGTVSFASNIKDARNPDVLTLEMRETRHALTNHAGSPRPEIIAKAKDLDQEYILRMGAGRNRLIGKSYGTASTFAGTGAVLTTGALAPPFTPIAAAGSAAASLVAGRLDYANMTRHMGRLNMKRADVLTDTGKAKRDAGLAAHDLDAETDIDAKALKTLRKDPVHGRLAGIKEIYAHKLGRYQEQINQLRNSSRFSPSRLRSDAGRQAEITRLETKRDALLADIDQVAAGNLPGLDTEGVIARSLTSDFQFYKNAAKSEFDKPGNFKANLAEGYFQSLQTVALPVASAVMGPMVGTNALDLKNNPHAPEAARGLSTSARIFQAPSSFATDDHKNSVSKQAMSGINGEIGERMKAWKMTTPNGVEVDLSKTGAAWRDAQPSAFKRFSHGLVESAGGFFVSLTTPFQYTRAKIERGRLAKATAAAEVRLAAQAVSAMDTPAITDTPPPVATTSNAFNPAPLHPGGTVPPEGPPVVGAHPPAPRMEYLPPLDLGSDIRLDDFLTG